MSCQSNSTPRRRTYEETVLAAQGLTIEVQVTSADETAATGDRVLEIVNELFANSPASALAYQAFNFSNTVTCPLSFSFGDVDYAFVATFTPNYVDASGATQAEAEHTLVHGLSMLYMGLINDTLCSVGDSGVPNVLDMLRSAFSGSGASSGSISIIIGGSGLGDPYGDELDLRGIFGDYPGPSRY